MRAFVFSLLLLFWPMYGIFVSWHWIWLYTHILPISAHTASIGVFGHHV